jgi:hypothetical protein
MPLIRSCGLLLTALQGSGQKHVHVMLGMTAILPATFHGVIDPLMNHTMGNHRTAAHPRQVRSAIHGQQTIRGNSACEATTMLSAHR